MDSNKLRNLSLMESIMKIHDSLKQLFYKYFVSDEMLIRVRFRNRIGREVNLKNPKKYNDKLQWLKLNWYDPIATKCADKFEVRAIVREEIGEEYLNELIAVYESVDEINIDDLPDKFVLKGTHGSGFNVICENKATLNWTKESRNLRRWLKINYYLQNREWVYKDIKPRIICEKYLEEAEAEDLKDYKIFCFNGEPKIIEVDIDRFQNHKRNFYDVNWNFIDCQIKYPNDISISVPKPIQLSEMLDLSRVLSKKFPHVRVDFFIIDDQIKFGELTFFHESGMGLFKPEEFEIKMGDWLELPKKTEVKK